MVSTSLLIWTTYKGCCQHEWKVMCIFLHVQCAVRVYPFYMEIIFNVSVCTNETCFISAVDSDRVYSTSTHQSTRIVICMPISFKIELRILFSCKLYNYVNHAH